MRRLRIAGAVVGAGIALAAGAGQAWAGQPTAAVPAPTAAAAASHTYQTLVTGLHSRSYPTTSAATVKVLGAAGTPVAVGCWVAGQSIYGDTIWYGITSPSNGYVSGYYLNTGKDPAAGIPHCGGTQTVFPTTVTGVHSRSYPTTSAATVKVLGAAGTKVTVGCWVAGQSIYGDTIWYGITSPSNGYVSGYYLATGKDPAAGIRHCGS